MTKREIRTMAEMAAEMLHLTATGQTVAMQLLLAEMEALKEMMPGTVLSQGPENEGERQRHEAEVEADFDNMPV